MHHALTIAGSDSGGGAGIQADLKTFAAHGVYGTSAITAITAQNTERVTAVHVLPPDIVAAQIDAVAADIRIDAVKTGMLANAAIVEAVAAAIRRWALPHVVVDPVMVAKSGDRLLDARGGRLDAAGAAAACGVVTPNRPEAEVLAGMPRSHERRRARGGAADCGRRLPGGGHQGRPLRRRATDEPAVRRARFHRVRHRARRTPGTRTAPAARSPRRSPRSWRCGRSLPDAVQRRDRVRRRRDRARGTDRPRPRAG